MMKLKEILELLRINEEQFLNMSEPEWTAKVNQTPINDEVQKNELLNLNDQRGTFFINTLRETLQPPPDNFLPLMRQRAIERFLGIDKIQFLTMEAREWDQRVDDAMVKLRGERRNIQALDDQETFLLNLTQIDARKQFFVDGLDKYVDLQKLANGTPPNIARQQEIHPPVVVAPEGSDSRSIFTAAGDKPEERTKNKEAIKKEYRETMEAYYNNLPPEQQAAQSKKKFLKDHSPKEHYFKSLEELEKHEVFAKFSDATKNSYREQRDGFPMNIMTLPFKGLPAGQDATFMKSMADKGFMKPMPPAAKKEEAEDKKVDLTSNTPLPGAETLGAPGPK